MSNLMKVIPGDRIVLVDTDLLTYELQVGSWSYNKDISKILDLFDNVLDYRLEAPENGKEINIVWNSPEGITFDMTLAPCEYTGIWEKYIA